MSFLSGLLASIMDWLIQNDILPWLKKEVSDAVDDAKSNQDQQERDNAKTPEQESQAAQDAASDTFG